MTPDNTPSDVDSSEEKSTGCCHGGGWWRTEHRPQPTEKTGNGDDNIGDALYLVPTDRGWAWVICAGCFAMTFIMSLYDQVLAVMFVDVVEKFDVSTTTAALVFTIHAFTFSAGSIISTNMIIPKCDERTVIVIAAIINSAATIVISFSPNMAFYLIFHLFKGLSIGSMWIPALGLLGHYFQRRRSLASTMTNAGIGVSLLVTPPFVRVLLDNFGFRGTLLIISGVEMQAIAMGMLLRPPSVYTRQRRNTPTDLRLVQERTNQKELCSLLDKNETQNDLDTSDVLVHVSNNDNRIQSVYDTCSFNKPGNSNPVFQFEDKINQDSTTSQYNPPPDMITTDIDVPCTENFKETNLISSTSKKQNSEQEHICLLTECPHSEDIIYSEKAMCNSNDSDTVGKILLCSAAVKDKGQHEMEEKPSFQHQNQVVFGRSACEFLSKLFDFRLLSDWLMRLLLASTVFGALLVYVPTYIPTLAVQKGVGKSSAAILLTVCGGVSLLSSLLQGFVIDCKLITASKFIVFAQVVVGTMCHLTYFFNSFPTLLFLSVTHGMFGGARMSLMPVVAMDFVGVENLSKALGFNAMVATLSLSLHHPFLGYLLEATKSFAVSFHYVGFALYASAGLMLLETCGRDLNAKRKQHRHSKMIQDADVTD